ncbi:alkaline phosphatase, tissue-nonspecific isozyme-like [Amphiura filiformis]|uniref:alkaline phosphatase, tissue-nonspecific isozyme-like n=1 Tax=Amphiura filiformis TaxID=82378 RepID=UPI003B212A29
MAAAMNCKNAVDRPAEYWFQEAQLTLQNALKQEKLNTNVARNLIIFLGDGMSLPTVTAARILKGQNNGQPGEEGFLSWETFPHFGLSKTYNTDAQVPDSAGTATAFLCGAKTKSGVVGLDDNALYGSCATAAGNEVESILKLGRNAGKSVGIVTTARLTHATPSAAYAHTPARGWECDWDVWPPGERDCKDIAVQFLENFDIQVALGGGREKFLKNSQTDPEEGTGERSDNRDLTEEWVAARSQLGTAKYVWEKTGFDAIDPANVDYLLGLFNPSHMEYHTHPDIAGEPTLAEMTQKAIQILQKNPYGFVLLVEAGRIDHSHHSTRAGRALYDTLALDEAVTMAQSETDSQETLTVVTADHSHTMAIAGYPARGNPILGKSGEAGTDQLPYTTLIYANGPGGEETMDSYILLGDRPDVTNVDTAGDSYRQQAIVPKSSETHGGDDVGIWANGPLSHLFHSTHEQHYIMHVMAYAACIDVDKAHCSPKKKFGSVAEMLRDLRFK